MTSFAIDYPLDHFSLPLCVSSGQVFRWQELADGRWLGVEGDHWYLVRIESDGPYSRYEVTSSGSEHDFSSLFRLDWSTTEIEGKILERGPELAPYMAQLRGLRVLRCSDPYETLFTFLCTPNNNLRRITQMVRKLAEYGPVMAELEGMVVHRFPSVDVIAGIPEVELRTKGFGYRGATIPRVAQQLLNRPEGWLEALRADDSLLSRPGGEGPNHHSPTASYAGAHAELCSLHGIGPKLADCIALFGLHHMESAPVDTHLWQAACRLYFPGWAGKAVTDARYRELGDFLRDRFGDLTGWAHQYLFYENLLNWRKRT